MPCEKQLWEQLVQAAEEKASGDLLTAFQYLQGGKQEDGTRLMLTDNEKRQ